MYVYVIVDVYVCMCMISRCVRKSPLGKFSCTCGHNYTKSVRMQKCVYKGICMYMRECAGTTAYTIHGWAQIHVHMYMNIQRNAVAFMDICTGVHVCMCMFLYIALVGA